MKQSKYPFLVVALLLALATTVVYADGIILAIKPADGGRLIYGEWPYREISTRRSPLWPGCWSYKCNWFFSTDCSWGPSTFYQSIKPTAANDDNGDVVYLEYRFNRSMLAGFCNAKTDGDSSAVNLKQVTKDGSELYGFLVLIPDPSISPETTDTLTIRCGPGRLFPSRYPSAGISCQEAHIPWNGKGRVDITVMWEEEEQQQQDGSQSERFSKKT